MTILTERGRRKLQSVKAAARQAAARVIAQEIQKVREMAAAGAPDPASEAIVLSSGQAQQGIFAGQTVGTPEGDRFIRLGGQMSLREAILTDPVTTRVTRGRVVFSTGNMALINTKTGFFWATRKRGIQGPTLPFNAAYVQAVEDGGVVWTVVPRPGTRSLEPEPGVFTQQMAKTVRPYGMFRRALATRDPQMRSSLRAQVRREVRQVGTV